MFLHASMFWSLVLVPPAVPVFTNGTDLLPSIGCLWFWKLHFHAYKFLGISVQNESRLFKVKRCKHCLFMHGTLENRGVSISNVFSSLLPMILFFSFSYALFVKNNTEHGNELPRATIRCWWTYLERCQHEAILTTGDTFSICFEPNIISSVCIFYFLQGEGAFDGCYEVVLRQALWNRR